MGLTVPWNRIGTSLLAFMLFVSVLAAGLLTPRHAAAVAALAQTPQNTTASGASSVSLGYATAPTANDLLVAICATNGAVTITAPSGFTNTAINQSGTPSQGIFWKIATGSEGTGSLTCGGGSSTTRWGMQLYEYEGIVTSSPVDGTPASATGSSTTASTGSTTTTNANDLVIAGIASNTGTAFTSWTNSFTQENNMTISTGGTRMAFGGAQRIVTATGSYSTAVTAGNAAWRGQIVAFKESTLALTADVVDGSGNPVASPSVAMAAANRKFACQTVTGTLGASTQKMRVNNTTANAAWTLSMAATSGNTTKWTTGTVTYYFNNPTSSGCTNGQLTVNPAVGTLTPQSGCANTNVSLGSSTAYNSGVTDSVTIATATASAAVNCYWDITGVSLSQKIPGTQANGSYSIGMTLTITAN